MPFGLRNAGQTFQTFHWWRHARLDFVFCYIDDLLISSSSPEFHCHPRSLSWLVFSAWSIFITDLYRTALLYWAPLQNILRTASSAQSPLFRIRGTTSLSVRYSLGAPAITVRFLPARWRIIWCCWWRAASKRWWNVTTVGILLSPIHCPPMPLQHIRQRTLRYVHGNQAFTTFCWGSPLTVCTDHRPLTFMLTKRVDNDWTPRQQRYISFIAEFATSIVFLSGRNNVVCGCTVTTYCFGHRFFRYGHRLSCRRTVTMLFV